MAEVVSTGVSHMCDNSTVSINDCYISKQKTVALKYSTTQTHANCL